MKYKVIFTLSFEGVEGVVYTTTTLDNCGKGFDAEQAEDIASALRSQGKSVHVEAMKGVYNER